MRDSLHRRGERFRDLIDRRAFLSGSLIGVASIALWPGSLRAAKRTGLSPEHEKQLASSPYVYVSPLLSAGGESSCHGEVWFGWIDGSVVVNTSVKTWKARSLSKGLQRARIWIGDYGRWKQTIGRNEAFRAGPFFDARATISKDAELLEKLLALYEIKYPDEIANWSDKMRAGFHDGSRVLIQYEPV